jgi:hypothetical protein
MTMPILPALMGTADAAPPISLADIFATLEDDQVNELVATAEAAGFGLEDVNPDLEQPEAGTVDNDEALSEEGVDDGGSAEAAVNPDDAEGAEDTDEEEVTVMEGSNLDEVVDSAVSKFDGLDAQLVALQGYLDAASEAADSGADADSIQALVEKAEEVIEAADEAVIECKDACSSDDAHGCAIAALKVIRAERILGKLVEQAAVFAETTDAPEPGPQDDPAMKLWAERMAPKGGPL